MTAESRGRIAGKVALITGGGTGIGRATALLFAREGSKVMVAGNYPGTVADVVGMIENEGNTAVGSIGDVREAADAERMVEETVARFGRIDILFNNAGIEYVAPIHETPEDKWDLVVDTNLKSIYQVSKFAIPHMIKQNAGIIINTASQLGLVATFDLSAYCASKGGAINLTRAMALDLAKYNIRVNALCPGAVETPMLLRQFEGHAGPQGTLQDLAGMHAMKRIGQPIELAYPALFLASEESSFMTGSALVVDGGYIAS
jgi:NAD(P)-dependent dehydrogenase (short-subunit alcohol dehydrogenase family)